MASYDENNNKTGYPLNGGLKTQQMTGTQPQPALPIQEIQLLQQKVDSLSDVLFKRDAEIQRLQERLEDKQEQIVFLRSVITTQPAGIPWTPAIPWDMKPPVITCNTPGQLK